MSAVPVNVHGVYKRCCGASMLATVRVRIGVLCSRPQLTTTVLSDSSRNRHDRGASSSRS